MMKKIGLANLLTIFRLACIPVFITVFACKLYGIALAVFVLAGLSDLVDGTIARMRKENSELGALLDPVADKGLMLGTFISLTFAKIVPWMFIWIILFRDAVVVFGFVYAKVKKIDFSYTPVLSSKLATLFEIITGVTALFYLTVPVARIWVYPIGDLVFGLIMITSVLILVAAMQYLKLGLRLLENSEKKTSRSKS